MEIFQAIGLSGFSRVIASFAFLGDTTFRSVEKLWEEINYVYLLKVNVLGHFSNSTKA